MSYKIYVVIELLIYTYLNLNQIITLEIPTIIRFWMLWTPTRVRHIVTSENTLKGSALFRIGDEIAAGLPKNL